jgi:hypothetical protein
MPIKRIIPLRDIAANGTTKVTLKCPRGLRYHKINCQQSYTGGTNTIAGAITNFLEVRVKLNNRVQRKLTSQELLDVNLFNGTQYGNITGELPNTAPGVSFPIFFAQPWRKDVATQDALAWSTGDLGPLEIEFDSTNAATWTFWATVDDVVFGKPQGIIKQLPQIITAASPSADYTLSDKDGMLLHILLNADTGANVATSVTLRKGSTVVFDDVSAAVNKANLTNGDMFPIATGRTQTIYDVVVDADDVLESALPINDRDVNLTIKQAAASGSIKAIVERFGPPD